MSQLNKFARFTDDFSGASISLPTAATLGCPWVITDTSASGTPTYTMGGSEATLTLAATSEVENVCLSFGDTLEFDIDQIDYAMFIVKMGQATLNAASQVAFGLASARNDAIDSITAAALFRVIGADSTTAVVCETDDGTTDNDDVATSTTLINVYKTFVIDFRNGTDDVQFRIDGVQVASGTTFDMSGYSSGLQPFVQIQKTASTNTDSVIIDVVDIAPRRA